MTAILRPALEAEERKIYLGAFSVDDARVVSTYVVVEREGCNWLECAIWGEFEGT